MNNYLDFQLKGTKQKNETKLFIYLKDIQYMAIYLKATLGSSQQSKNQ